MSRPKPSSAMNGRLSQGPTTQAGKDRSRFNATVHGLSAKRLLLLKGESQEELNRLALSFNISFQPDSKVEQIVIDTMVAGEWRSRRAQSLETILFQKALDELPPDADPADAMVQVLESKAFSVLCRYQTMLENALSRGIRTMSMLKKNFACDTSGAERLVDEILAERAAASQQPNDEPVTPEPVAQPEPEEVPDPVPPKLTFTATATSQPESERQPQTTGAAADTGESQVPDRGGQFLNVAA